MHEPSRDSGASRAARRRHLAILFSDLAEFTALVGSVEPEYCLEVLDLFKQRSEEIVAKHGGIVVDFHGDGVMAMFGMPEASEYDGRRATEAAIDLHHAVSHLRTHTASHALPPLALHSGVHSGLVLVLDNDRAAGRYAVIGEAPTVAQRLSDIAARDEILVSATTLGGESHIFETRNRGDLRLQGRNKPVAVLQVLGHSAASRRYEARTEGALTPFIGRSRELDALHDCLREALAGGSRELAIIASAGVGKTRLVEQFLQSTAHLSVHVCRGYCENYLAAEPLQPFLQMLRQLARDDPGRSEPILSELQRALSTRLLSSTPSAASDSPEPARAFGDLFAALSRRRPLILFIDDWQWADDATQQCLAAVREMNLRSIFILIVCREPLSAATGGMATLNLTPWDDDETTKAIRTLRPEADPFAVMQIQHLSGGNPLFIEELCHWSSREPFSREPTQRDVLPAWLSTLIESRVGRLPPQQAELVHTAAVIGSVFPLWLFTELTGHTEDDPLVRDLADKDLIFPGDVEGTLRFKHGVTRDVVYASVGLRERELLHLRVAELLERRSVESGQEGLLESLSYHFRAAAKPEKAASYAELAGDRALGAAAPDKARSQYAAALTALDQLQNFDTQYERWSRIVHRLGLACVFDPTRDQLAVFSRAVELAHERGDQAGLARAEYWRGFIHYALGDPREAIAHYELARNHCFHALQAARLANDTRRTVELEAMTVQLLATVGQARASAGEHQSALALLDEALIVKRRHRSGTRPAVGSAYTLACKGAVLGDLGRFAEAHDCFAEALEAIRPGQSPVEASIHGWHAAVYAWQGRWEEARDAALRAESLARRVSGLYILAMGQAIAAYATWRLERTPASIDTIVRATSWLEAHDKRLSISTNYGWLSEIMASEGRHKQARLYAARAIQRARVGDVLGEATAYRAMATLPPRRRSTPAEKYLAQAMRSALARQSQRDEALTLLHQAQHAARRARPIEAAHLAERARSAFIVMAMPWHHSAADRCLADLRLSPSSAGQVSSQSGA